MNKTAEVVIIGGGVNGCAAAYYLAKKGVKDVVVLEATNSIGHGGSSRNGGGVRQSGRDVILNIPRKEICEWVRQKNILKSSGHLQTVQNQ